MVREQIRENYSKLTKTQRKVADFIFDHMERTAVMTTVKISEAAGTSETTVIRLAYALGYDSFSQLQKQIQEDVLRQSDTRRSNEDEPDSNDYQRMLGNQIKLLAEMRREMKDAGQLRNIASRVAAADRVMVLGYYGEHTVSYELYLMLDSIRPQVHYYRENNAGYREIAELNARSVVLSISFRPYCPGTLELVQQTRERGAYMIAITDSPLSPIAQLSDEVVTLAVDQDQDTGINCMAPVMAYNFLLTSAVKDCGKEEALRRIKTVQSQLVQPGTSKGKGA